VTIAVLDCNAQFESLAPKSIRWALNWGKPRQGVQSVRFANCHPLNLPLRQSAASVVELEPKLNRHYSGGRDIAAPDARVQKLLAIGERRVRRRFRIRLNRAETSLVPRRDPNVPAALDSCRKPSRWADIVDTAPPRDCFALLPQP
jgi:hypothetical protein